MTIMNCLSDNEMRNAQSVNSLILCCLFNAKIPYALDFFYRTDDTILHSYGSLLYPMQLIFRSYIIIS